MYVKGTAHAPQYKYSVIQLYKPPADPHHHTHTVHTRHCHTNTHSLAIQHACVPGDSEQLLRLLYLTAQQEPHALMR